MSALIQNKKIVDAGRRAVDLNIIKYICSAAERSLSELQIQILNCVRLTFVWGYARRTHHATVIDRLKVD